MSDRSSITAKIKNASPLLVCFLLATITLALYWPVRSHAFINFDDPNYVYENEAVQRGLSWDGVVWAFSGQHEANYHPLTWLSHMWDCQVYGLQAGHHHWHNVLLHAASGVMLFLLLRLMTGALWRSAFLAALFLLHPTHVESVAWVAERKDVLSGLFFMLTLWSYVKYTKTETPGKARRWYALSLVAFSLGLLAKSMLVTVPFVLLLVDFWPLTRMELNSWRQRAREKIPYFALTFLFCVVTFISQDRAGAMAKADVVPLASRLANAVVAVERYLGKLFWPQNLSIFYPLVPHWPLLRILTALALVTGLSLLAIGGARKRPWFAVGWFWFLGMLVPVIGLVQVGRQSMADRYTYLPSIGLFLGAVWLASEFFSAKKTNATIVSGILATIILSASFVTARIQIGHWQNSGTLMGHALVVNPTDFNMADNLGLYQYRQGDREGAFKSFRQALAGDPNFAQTYNTMGMLLMDEGKNAEAIACFRKAVEVRPDHAKSLLFLGDALRRVGQFTEAQAILQKAMQLEPNSYQAHYIFGNLLDDTRHPVEAVAEYQRAAALDPAVGQVQASLGAALIASGRPQEAPAHFQTAITLEPTNAKLRSQVARSLLMLNALEDALTQYREAVRLDPDLLPAIKDLSWLLSTGPRDDLRNGAEALQLAEHASRLTGYTNSTYTGLLDAAYAEAGRFPEAIAAAEKVRAQYLATGHKDLADLTAQRLELYRVGKKYHIGGH